MEEPWVIIDKVTNHHPLRPLPVVRSGQVAGEDVCGFYFPCRNPLPVLVPAAPKVPHMAMYNDRFATFASWPPDKTQRPRDLAAAGLFYVGQDDQTMCFHCGGNLHRWDPTDDPWVEHAKFYPNCKYLIASRGQEFIDSVRPQGIQAVAVIPRASLTNSSQGSSGSQSSGIEDEHSSSYESSFSDRSLSDEESEQEIIGQAVHSSRENTSLMDCIQQAVRENRQNLSFARFRNEKHLIDAAKAIQDRIALQKEMLKKEAEREVPISISSDIASITKEYERLRNERICKVCLDKESELIFIPCGHMVCCAQCAGGVRACPVCRSPITLTSRVYLS